MQNLKVFFPVVFKILLPAFLIQVHPAKRNSYPTLFIVN